MRRRPVHGAVRSASAGACAWFACASLVVAGSGFAAETAPDPGGDPAAGAITFYQRYVSSLRHSHCQFDPSCSGYALAAVRSHGLLAGTALAADRLVRCNASASRFYARGRDGRLRDPVDAPAPPRRAPRVPRWLVAAASDVPPLGSESEQRLSEYLSFARELAQAGDCERAATEYARAAHLAAALPFRAWAHLRGGSCFFDQEDWAGAESEFLQAGMLAPGASERRQARDLAAASRFNAADYDGCAALAGESGAESLLATVDTVASVMRQAGGDAGTAHADLVPIIQEIGLRGISSMARGDWDGARLAFERGSSISGQTVHPAKLRFLAAQSAAGKSLPRKSPRLATVLSAVVPGLGQVYAGRTQDGLRHLIFNAALLYTVAELVRDEHYPAAYLVAGIELPFYLGNIRGGKANARSFNFSRRMEFVAAALAQSDR